MLAAALQLITLMAVFSIIEGLWPSSREHKWWRRSLLVDLCSWSIHPIAIAAGIALAVAFTDAFLAQFANNDFLLTFVRWRARVAEFPSLVQMTLALVITDFLSYWIHRGYHRFALLWSFHIVHHTSETLDWLSTSRLHPLSQMLNTALMAASLLLAGLPVKAVVAANLIVGAAALLVHANVPWNFGPFRHLFVSPLFHQWHHARVDDDARHHKPANFGALFSIWDRLFGTWSLPSSNRPARFGVEDAPAQTILGLFLHPFRTGLRFVPKPTDHNPPPQS